MSLSSYNVAYVKPFATESMARDNRDKSGFLTKESF
jgi:hypothetical protein